MAKNGQIKGLLNRLVQPIGTMFFLKITDHIVSYVKRITMKNAIKMKKQMDKKQPIGTIGCISLFKGPSI
jgi:hypothetical protein